MTSLRTRYLGLLAASIGIAALLGASLGLAAAAVRTQPLAKGFNLAGGPLVTDVAPDEFVSCLPQDSWNSLYIWDSANQKWTHYFNEDVAPAYVNRPEVGGITIVKRHAGVVLIMDKAVQSPHFVDRPTEACK